MKKIPFLFLLFFLSLKSFSQGGSTGNTFSGGYLGWDGTNGINPVFLRTNATDRMVINGNKAVGINGYNGEVTNGFVGIGQNLAAQSFPFNGGNAGPFSLLHLNSGIGGFVQSFGWRPWMKYGITSTHNQDFMFFGQRQNGSGFDVTDVVIGWADNAGAGNGPDNMVFNFLQGVASDTNYANGDLTGMATNGREIMRMTGYGNVGIGPRFNNTWQPQSTLHQHQENNQPSWMQISNQFSTGVANANGPTAITQNDGLRWGIDAGNTGYLYNQENNHLLFGTNHIPGNTFGGTLERMRITHIGAPGTANPGNLATNITRVAISHNPLAPVTRPLSLLHLGYNTGGVSTNPNATDGWRPWMDIGMFVTNNTDNVYIGLKDEAGFLGDRQDAIISWGDNQINGAPPANSGPDNFRFIFTSTTTGSGGTAPATGTDGLEGMRLSPTPNNGVYTGVGGAPGGVNPYSTGINPGNTLEVNSWGGSATTPGGSSGLRFTDLNSSTPTVPNPGTGVLSVAANGDVIYVPGGGAANADNGLSTNGPNAGAVHLGQNLGAAGNPGQLLNNREVPMNAFNLLFSNDGRIGLGSLFTGGAVAPLAKMDIRPNTTDQLGLLVVANNSVNASPLVAYPVSVMRNRAQGAQINYGLHAEAAGTPIKEATAYYGYASAPNVTNRGINTLAENGSSNQGGNFNAKGTAATGNVGVVGNGTFGNMTNIGGDFSAGNPINIVNGYNGTDNYGVHTIAYGGVNNYGIYAEGIGGTNVTYAGYFNGDVVRTGNDNFTSDINLKQNIHGLENAMTIISQLKPKWYEFKINDYPQMHLPTDKQYGLIAQDVKEVLPELVNSNTHPAVKDEEGNEVTPAVNFLTVEYQQFIGIIIKALQEQQKKIDDLEQALKEKDNELDARLTALENAMKECCPGTAKRGDCSKPEAMDVQLGQRDVIILNQNVPNPFAEQTTITYSVPESVGSAQIIFYTNAGQVIRTVDIKTRGNGTVNVFAADLSSGVYHYTLIADGKVIDNKKMVKE